jgi:hypothetical protein
MTLSKAPARGVSFAPSEGEHCLMRPLRSVLLTVGLLSAAGCSPVVRVEAPTEPITINLNIKLDADVRLRVEEKAKEDVQSKPIF